MLPSEILQRVAVRIECKNLTGSGCLFQPETDEFTYVLTAKHCLINGENGSPPMPEEITITCHTAIQLSNPDVLDYYLDENLDLALIRIEYVPGVPLLKTAVARDNVLLKMRGFPDILNNEAETLAANFVEQENDIIKLRVDATLSTFNYDARHNVEGFSGAGIYIDLEGRLYLTGILTNIGNPEGAFDTLKGISIQAFARVIDTNSFVSLPLTYATKLDEGWFDRHLKTVTKMAEPRYTPELNVDVPIAQAFEAFGLTSRWEQSVEEWAKKISQAAKNWSRTLKGPNIGPEETDFPEAAKAPAESLLSQLYLIRDKTRELLASGQSSTITELSSLLDEALQLARDCYGIAKEELEAKHGKGTADSQNFRQWMAEYQGSFPAKHVDTSKEVIETLEELFEWVNSPQLLLPTASAMLVTGVAGSGKTHSICDHALARYQQGLRSIVFLGEQFSSGTPWEQMRQLLGFDGTISQEMFLSELNAIGQFTGYPCIIFIDALNETIPRSFWRSHLAGLIQQMSNYERVKLCVSCRTTYLADTMAANVNIPQIEHTGFAGVEFDACFEFFRFYKLEPPAMPLMQPEFANPLFLRLVCESLAEAGLNRLPDGMQGISEVIRFLLETKNSKISTELDAFARDQLVQKALNQLVSEMQQTQTRWLPWSTARALIGEIWPTQTRSSSLFDLLIREGLIREDRMTNLENTEITDVVRFAFERLGEHLLVQQYLADHSLESVKEAFATNGALHFVVCNSEAIQEHRGLLEALAVQIPEKFGIELTELVSSPELRPMLLQIVIEALIWRLHDSISADTETLMEQALSNSTTFPAAMEALFALSTRAGNRLNAFYFHNTWAVVPMARRDGVLSGYFHSTYGEQKGLDRLLRWALKSDLSTMSDETVELWVTQLCWFCAAADRRVRDHATKAMVRLMSNYPHKWIDILKRFFDFDDDYVLERCLAACYGSLIRANDNEAIRVVAEKVYLVYFKRKFLPTNASIRDYARLIVELAPHRNLLDNVDVALIRPSYDSDWPVEWPDEAFVEQYKDSDQRLPKLYRSCFQDDFNHYTLGIFDDFEGVNRQQVARWIFKHVIDMGYDQKQSTNYDGYMISKYGALRHRPTWAERIGKKYQWIALYRLMGIIGDHLSKESRSWSTYSPTVPELQAASKRNIDPTILLTGTENVYKNTWWLRVGYNFAANEAIPDTEWLKRNDFPSVQPALQIRNPYQRKRWFLLNTRFEWSSKALGEDESYPYRHVSVTIRSHLVRRAEAEECREWLSRERFITLIPRPMEFHTGFFGEYPWGLPFVQDIEELTGERSFSEALCDMHPTANIVHSDYDYDSYQQGSIRTYVPSTIFFEHDQLTWNAINGYLANNQLSFMDPSLVESGPTALLADTEYLSNFLARNDLALIWTAFWEKAVIDLSHSGGLTECSQIYTLEDDEIKLSPGLIQSYLPDSEERK